jgi:putative membrane protein
MKGTEMMGYGSYGWGGMGVGGMIGMVVFWLVLIAVIVWAVSRLLPGRQGRQGHSEPGQETPVEILDRRFARGEVDVETYQMQRPALVSARGEGQR